MCRGLARREDIEQRIERRRRGYEALNRRDFDAALEDYAPDAEFDNSEAFLDGRAYRGIAALRSFMEHIWERWGEEFQLHPREFIGAGEHLVVVCDMRGSGSVSGVPIESQWVHVYTYRGESIVRHRSFRDRVEALRAVGVEPTERAPT
jgi:ketosteroid isomerase-like protein